MRAGFWPSYLLKPSRKMQMQGKIMNAVKKTFDAQPAARLFYDARKTRHLLDALPSSALPKTEEEADLIQDEVAKLTGPVLAWKVGAASPSAMPSRAPIHAETLFINPARIPASLFSYIGAEAEIAYKFAKDLSAQDGGLTLEDVLDAVESVHPAIEIVDTRFSVWDSQPKLAHMADQGNHGALMIGAPIPDWRAMKPQAQRVTLEINGVVVGDKIDGNTAGNPEALLLWLANGGAKSLGGIKAGQYVTTGSCAGTVMVKAPVEVTASLVGRGALTVVIE